MSTNLSSDFGPESVMPADDQQPTSPLQPTDISHKSWWSRYSSSLTARLSPVAIEVLETDANYIIDRAMPLREGRLAVDEWSANSRIRSGMVVGSVQSGKTASMLGVAALALDRGTDLIILLAGTRVNLWLQTYERLLAQLDGSTPDTAFHRRNERLILPQPADILNEQRADPTRYLQRPLARIALRTGKPIICIVPKEDDHLLALRRFLHLVINDTYLDERAAPYTMLLLDDEADDASVLDSENSLKLTPRLITALWSGDTERSETRHEKILASYVAYTATPQANYLQATHNPLSPRNFNVALRVPGSIGTPATRTLTYSEPAGISGYYCGGETFYNQLQSTQAALCMPSPFPTLHTGESQTELELRHEKIRWTMLSDALRSFLVGAAIRLIDSGKSLSCAYASCFPTAELARLASPPPHTMLHHPSARKDDHFNAAIDIVRWSMAVPGEESSTVVPGEDMGTVDLVISADHLANRLHAEEEAWKNWLIHFENTRVGISTFPRAPYAPINLESWPIVRETLVNEIFPHIALRVLNSDPNSSERPRFDPLRVGDTYRVAPDLLSIFVAGNVLSRGLTLEGLATSLFLRGSNEPAADTQMQMQRWFGYRGKHLVFCRVLMFEDQLELFRSYHVNDSSLKTEIMKQMEDGSNSTTSSVLILQGASFVATSKVDCRRVPLSPGPRPSIRLVEAHDHHLISANVALLDEICSDGDWIALNDDRGFRRGSIRRVPVDLLTLAGLLEKLQYRHHDPDLRNEFSERWEHYRVLLGLRAPLFRPPGNNATSYAAEPQSCPYSIAAYLRLWAALKDDRHAPGFYPTDRPDVPWNYSDSITSNEPKFYIAIRFGDQDPYDPRLRQHGIRAMTRQLSPNRHSLQTLWGSRGYGNAYFGDELVDYYHHQTLPVPSIEGGATWRPRGHPGLALFHVIRDPASRSDLVTVGLGLPHGGPDHIAALRA